MNLRPFALSALLALAPAFPAHAAPPAPAPAAQVVSNPEAYLGKVVTVPRPNGPPQTFRLEKVLGSGYWSHAFAGSDVASGSAAALKVQYRRGTGQDSFDRESDILRRAANPRLPKAYGIGTTEDGERAMAMELVEGRRVTGGAFAKRSAPEPQGTSVQIGMQILRGARALEKTNLRHNDIHPGNVLARDLDPATVKLIDVGNATPASDGSRGGNRFYSAPEHGAANDDVYSAGAITIQLLTGVPSREALPRIANPGLRAVLMKMTHPDPAQRYRTTQEGIDALRPYQNEMNKEPANRRAALSTFYGNESVALASFGGMTGGADLRSPERHAGWATSQSPEAVGAELLRKLDSQMLPGHALSNPEALARHYADFALQTNATGATLGKYAESPDWNAHYNWAKRASPQSVRGEFARRTGMVVQALSAP